MLMEFHIRCGEDKSTSAISFDEKGNTGNVREGDSIVIEDSTIPGDRSDKMTLDVKVNLVLKDGDSYTNPKATIGVYDGDIQTKESVVNLMNEREYFYYLLPEGQTEWTIETYEKTMESNDRDPWFFVGTVLYDDIFTSEITVESTFNPKTGQMEYIFTADGKIFTITELGIEGKMIELWNKLHKVKGEDTKAEELKDSDDSDDDPDTPDDSGGDSSGKGGEWSDYGAASVSANVWSDKYDVSFAIPTSEMVNGSVTASDMSWYYNIKKESDAKTYTIDGITIHWEPYEYEVTIYDGEFNSSGDWVITGSHQETRIAYRYSDTVSVTGTYTTHYFSVARAEMNKLSQEVDGSMRGGATVSNSATGVLASVGGPDLAGSISRTGGIVFDEGRMNKGSFSTYAETRDGAIASAQSIIASRIKNASYVKNDELVIKSDVLGGQTEWGEEFKDTPYQAPSYLTNPSIGSVSSSGSKMIPSNKANGNYGSSASARYIQVPGFDGRGDYSIGAGAPSVFVYTPVVNNSTVKSEAFVNQKITQESGITYLQLDKKFTITIPRAGTHISAKGYGSRNYNSYQAVPGSASNWGKLKDVKLPFDAYLQPSNILIKANTWLSDVGLATTQESYTFLIPVWAQEAKGEIEVRVVAENTAVYSGSSCLETLIQDGANLSYTRYVAEKKIPIEVIGKIYDLRISSTNDPWWPGIIGKIGKYITSQEFPFGQSGQNQMKQYKFAPKLGYMVEFDFKTKGVKTDNVDASVQPKGFYFIGKNGGTAEEVDLYFKTSINQYIKISTTDNNPDILVNLSNKFMQVTTSELIDSRRIMKDQVGVLYTYAENVLIGKVSAMQIPEKLRLCYNNFAEYVNKLYGKDETAISNDANGGLSYSTGKYDKVTNGRDTVIASVGHWYAAYRLPSSTIAVPKGTTVKQILANPDIAKKNGYILIKFDIIGKDGDDDYLRYTGPESLAGTYEKDEDGNEQKWQDPETGKPDSNSPNQKVDLPNGNPGVIPDGIVILFETDLRANDDYEVVGTH